MPDQAEETKNKLKKLGLEICCLGTSVSFHDPNAYDRAIKEGRDSIDVAQRLKFHTYESLATRYLTLLAGRRRSKL